jgi:hypothetical protein
MLAAPGMFLLGLAPMAKASFVFGQFAPGATSVEVTSDEMLFYNLGVTLATPSGVFTLDTPSTNSFAPLLGDNGSVMDLTSLSSDPSCVGCIYAPVDTALSANTFMQLPASGTTIDLSIGDVSAGQDTPGTPLCSTLTFGQLTTSGTSCTPTANSPFILSNVTVMGTLDTFVSFSATGTAWFTATPAQISTAVYSFTTSFAGQSIAGVLANIQSTGSVVSALGGDVVVTAPSSVPEPMTFSLIGVGLLVLGILKRRG